MAVRPPLAQYLIGTIGRERGWLMQVIRGDGGHLIPIEDPWVFVEALLEFARTLQA